MSQQYGLYNTDPVTRTFMGHWVNLFDPKEETICIEDIAHHLSLVCRFGGAVIKHYSVAQHSIHCAEYLSKTPVQIQFDALMHDASEAYIQDIVRPLKLRLTEYGPAEAAFMEIIAKKFGVQWPFHPLVKQADEALLNLEWESLMLGQHNKIKPKPPERVEQEFLKRFYQLKQQIDANY